jgi:hypothetical protein
MSLGSEDFSRAGFTKTIYAARMLDGALGGMRFRVPFHPTRRRVARSPGGEAQSKVSWERILLLLASAHQSYQRLLPLRLPSCFPRPFITLMCLNFLCRFCDLNGVSA